MKLHVYQQHIMHHVTAQCVPEAHGCRTSSEHQYATLVAAI